MRYSKIMVIALTVFIIIAVAALIYLYFQDQPDITYQGTFVLDYRYYKG